MIRISLDVISLCADIADRLRGAKAMDVFLNRLLLDNQGVRCIITDNFILFPLDGGDYILHPVIGVSTQFLLKDVILNIQ